MIGKLRRALYALARILGDVQAVRKGPTGIAKRIIRKAAYRGFGRLMR